MSRSLSRILAVALTLAALSCKKHDPQPSRNTPVILISIDTLRSDHLPAYGYHGVLTPNIDRLRADSILFEHAYAHVPLTLASHATMLTGRLPSENGVRDNIGFRLDPKVGTLPAVLKRNGYATGAAVSAYVLRKETGIARGFDYYDDDVDANDPSVSVGRVQRRGEETTAVAEKWISAQAAKPFFFFLHLYEPHTPYSPPQPFLSRYPNHYDGEIACVDEIVGGFLQFLKKSDLYDRALIILVSDHGEGLDQHGEQEHGIFLYREALQVPLILKLPRSERANTTDSTNAQLLDLFPTIALQTSAGINLSGYSGSSLLGARQEARPIYSESYYARFHFGWSDQHSFIRAGSHYIESPKPELFDLSHDFDESRNILSDARRLYAELRTAIRPFIHEAANPSPVTEEEAAKLAALGYVGSAASKSGPLPDPKDRINTTKDIRRAFVLFDSGKYAETHEVLTALLRENPQMLDMWDMDARALNRLGRDEEAIAAAKNGLRLSPNTTHLAIMIARMSLDLGRLDEATQHAELALQSEPAAAHELLARIALARHDLDRAESEARQAVESKDRVAALLVLGEIALQRKNPAEALTLAQRAESFVAMHRQSPVKGVEFLKGDALARMDRSSEAETAFRAEIEHFPADPAPYKNLILLYVTQGRVDEATRLVFDLVKAAPYPPSYIAISSTLHTVGDDRGARYWAVEGLRRFPRNPALRKLAAG
ncbi:MAG TPA: sulfatase-like hydrolase/transferase [Thermoanaerobaculia bacterium]|nr:sulfatase-like hydrolase/transferase [Thermoanaerobaculia bacterium]